MCKCPSCNLSYRKRLSRNLIFKLIPSSKLFKCFHCKTKYLEISYLSALFIISKEVDKPYTELIN